MLPSVSGMSSASIAKRWKQRFAIDAEGIPETDGSIRKLRNRRLHKRVKAPGLEFNAKYPAFVFEKTCELPRFHAIDSRLIFLNDKVDARVRERLLHVRLLAPEIPTDDPIAFYEETQILCRRMSRKLKLLFTRFEVQNASRFSDC